MFFLYFFLHTKVEVGLQFLFGRVVFVVQVADDDTVFQQGDARTDVDRVVQVVAGDDDGGPMLFVVFLEQVLDDSLRRGVEEVERFVQYISNFG